MTKNIDITSAQYRLWHDYFMCEMRDIDTMSIDYIRNFGYLTTGDNELDRKMRNDLVPMYLTPIKMIEYYHEGVNVYIKNPEDTKTIYILIQEHLQNWQREAALTYRKDTIPTEELVLMDRFADAIYEHAKWYLDDALVDSPFAKTVKSARSEVLSMLKDPRLEAKDKDGEDIVLHPKRESMADIFNTGLAKLEKRF